MNFIKKLIKYFNSNNPHEFVGKTGLHKSPLSRVKMPECKTPRSETFNKLEVYGPSGKIYSSSYYNEMKHEIVWGEGGRTLKLFLRTHD